MHYGRFKAFVIGCNETKCHISKSKTSCKFLGLVFAVCTAIGTQNNEFLLFHLKSILKSDIFSRTFLQVQSHLKHSLMFAHGLGQHGLVEHSKRRRFQLNTKICKPCNENVRENKKTACHWTKTLKKPNLRWSLRESLKQMQS